MRVVALSLLIALSAVPLARAQERSVWTATCAQNGRTIYLERLAGRPTAAKEAEVIRRNPGAVCVFLAPEAEVAPPMGLQQILEASRPGVVPMPQDVLGAPGDINAALRALRGDALPVITPPVAPPAAPVVLPSASKPGIEIVAPGDSARPASPEWIRLAVYRNASQEDVLADWQRILRAERAFSPFRPSLSKTREGNLMLAVGPVPPAERAGLCLVAATLRLDCQAGDAPAPARPEVGLAVASLLRSYPGVLVDPRERALSLRVPAVQQDAGGVGDDLFCRRSRFDAPQAGIDLVGLGLRRQEEAERLERKRLADEEEARARLEKAKPQRRSRARATAASKSSSSSAPISSSASSAMTRSSSATDSAVMR